MATTSTTRYIEAVGRRKSAVARVRITPSTKADYTINDLPLEKYFPVHEDQAAVKDPFSHAEISQSFTVTAKIIGGGTTAQAEALRHGITRALVKYEGTLRVPLKREGFLKRDPRTKERKKFGLRKARRAPQWSKR